MSYTDTVVEGAMVTDKRFAFFDVLRLMSVMFVIVYHFAFYLRPIENKFYFIHLFNDGWGEIGVSFFFIMSGSLSYLSLNRQDTYKFYANRGVSILVPYNVTYIIMGLLFLFMSEVLQMPGMQNYPLTVLSHTSDFSYLYFIPTLLGMDGYLLSFHEILNVTSYFFIGEWFIGAIIFLILLAPLIRNSINAAPNLTVLFSVIVSCVLFFLAREYVSNPYWLFTSRLAEFSFGMYFIKNIEFMKKNAGTIALLSLVIVLTSIADAMSHGASFKAIFPRSPASLLTYIPLFYIVFYLCEKLNRYVSKINMLKSIAEYSYVMMLTQHVIIYFILSRSNLTNLSILGILSLFTISVALIFLSSFLISKISSPIERFIR